MAELTLAQLTSRVDLLEKNFNTHLGPAYAGTSLNDPHQSEATIESLTERVTVLETAMAAIQAYAYTSGRYM